MQSGETSSLAENREQRVGVCHIEIDDELPDAETKLEAGGFTRPRAGKCAYLRVLCDAEDVDWATAAGALGKQEPPVGSDPYSPPQQRADVRRLMP
jgi:hypothetical protein